MMTLKGGMQGAHVSADVRILTLVRLTNSDQIRHANPRPGGACL